MKELLLVLVAIVSIAGVWGADEVTPLNDEALLAPETDSVTAESSPAVENYTADIYWSKGIASWYMPDNPDTKQILQKYTQIPSGAIIETELNSSLIIQIENNQGYIYMGSNSRIQFFFSVSESKRIQGTTILLQQGYVRVAVPDIKSQFVRCVVVTTNASVGTRGGDFVVRSESKGSVVQSYHGELAVFHMPLNLQGQKGKVLLGESQGIGINTTRGFSKPKTIAASDSFWSNYNIDISFRKNDTEQDRIIKTEIKRIETDSLILRPVDLAR